MGFDEGRIILNSDNGTYFPGQPVHGKLIFNQDKVKNFRGIYAKLKGFCKVHWTTQRTRTNSEGKQQTYTENHESYEEYINNKVYLIGGENGEVELKPGQYEFPFQFFLPESCPSSYEGSVGHIRYEIKVVVDRAFKLDQEKRVEVRVVSLVDLNRNPYCKEPMEFEFDDTYCCCCISRGATDTIVKLPRSGFCPGQVIPVEVACENTGNVEIDKIKLIVKKVVTFHATTNPSTKEVKDVVAEVKKGPIPGNTTRNWNVDVSVPALDIYNLDNCRYIDLYYKFKVVVSPSGCHNDSEDSKRLIIGNVPLVGYQDNIQNPLHDQMPQINNLTVNQVSSYPTNTPYPNMSPKPGRTSPYPGNTGFPNVTPYPPGNPHPQTTPYPQNPYPAQTPYPPNPNQSPYPPNVTPYPNNENPSNPGSYPNPPYPQSNPPYPQNNPPYSQNNPPYPQTSPYPPNTQDYQATGLKTGSFGFTVPSSVPMHNNPPNPPTSPMNPYATASAPPDTPDKS